MLRGCKAVFRHITGSKPTRNPEPLTDSKAELRIRALGFLQIGLRPRLRLGCSLGRYSRLKALIAVLQSVMLTRCPSSWFLVFGRCRRSCCHSEPALPKRRQLSKMLPRNAGSRIPEEALGDAYQLAEMYGSAESGGDPSAQKEDVL